MDRREFLKGLLAAVAAAKIPLAIPAAPDNAYLLKLRQHLIDRIIWPIMIMHEDGTLTARSTKTEEQMLAWVQLLLEPSNVPPTS